MNFIAVVVSPLDQIQFVIMLDKIIRETIHSNKISVKIIRKRSSAKKENNVVWQNQKLNMARTKSVQSIKSLSRKKT